jgi:hypothetical protein
MLIEISSGWCAFWILLALVIGYVAGRSDIEDKYFGDKQ